MLKMTIKSILIATWMSLLIITWLITRSSTHTDKHGARISIPRITAQTVHMDGKTNLITNPTRVMEGSNNGPTIKQSLPLICNALYLILKSCCDEAHA